MVKAGEMLLDKFVPEEEHERLRVIVEGLKAAGKRVVFSNGCFNVLHVGHIRCLVEARAQGDVLIVALNSDESVRALKGDDYPLVPEVERAFIIGALECVDYVTIFSDRTVDRLLLLLKPHVHAKGSDYTRENLPERDTVLSYGGEIAITGGPKDHSTTEFIKWLSQYRKRG
jgi:rfaE bifunctional protein nucleotidyltransferase chain/domain